MHPHMSTSHSDCSVSCEVLESMPPSYRIVVRLENISMAKYRRLTDLAPYNADLEVSLKEPLDVLADGLLAYLGGTLATTAYASVDAMVIHLSCTARDNLDIATRHVQDYLRSRAGLTLQMPSTVR